MNSRVRFDNEADAEYRFAGRWYEARRASLGIEFFDAVDATIDQIAVMPHAGAQVRGLPADLTVRRRAVMRFPYHVVYWSWRRTFESSPLRTTDGNRAIGKTACRN